MRTEDDVLLWKGLAVVATNERQASLSKRRVMRGRRDGRHCRNYRVSGA